MTKNVIKFVAVGEHAKYGEKVALDVPYDAKEDVKELPWEKTHRVYCTLDVDGVPEVCWNIDLDGLKTAIDTLSEQGYIVHIAKPVKEAYEDLPGVDELELPETAIVKEAIE